MSEKNKTIFLRGFRGDAVSLQFQDDFSKGVGCDLMIQASSRESTDIIKVHTQVFSVYSKIFEKTIKTILNSNVISTDNPYTVYLKYDSIKYWKLITHLLYFGSVSLRGDDLEGFNSLIKEFRIKTNEFKFFTTPCMKKTRKRLRQKTRFSLSSSLTPGSSSTPRNKKKKLPITPFVSNRDSYQWIKRNKKPLTDKIAQLEVDVFNRKRQLKESMERDGSRQVKKPRILDYNDLLRHPRSLSPIPLGFCQSDIFEDMTFNFEEIRETPTDIGSLFETKSLKNDISEE